MPQFGSRAMPQPDNEVAILVVEDDAMVQDWLRAALDGSGFRLVGVAHTATEALDLVARRRPALLLVDQRLPDLVGTELIRKLRRLNINTPAVLMTANAEEGFNEAARDAGAQGTVLKTGKAGELLSSLGTIVAGRPSFDERHPRRAPGHAALSPREREVLRLVAAGSTNRDIAKTLSIGDETVKTLISRTFAKLGVHKRAEAVSEAHRRGLL
jgi:DNA-binding NarL/FixJ family response regulator